MASSTVLVLVATSLFPTIRKSSCWPSRSPGRHKTSRRCRHVSKAVFDVGVSPPGTIYRTSRVDACALEGLRETLLTRLEPPSPSSTTTRTTTTSMSWWVSLPDVAVTPTTLDQSRETSYRTTSRQIGAPTPTRAANACSAGRRNN